MNWLISLLAQANYKVDISPLPSTAATQGKIQLILTIVFAVIGALSLLMFTIGGFRYVASEGDPQATAKAKGTVVYSLIGLIVSISAVAIVAFVLRNI